MYVNGELGIAEAVIDPDTGFVIGARILNREITFDRFPAVDIVGGGGYGARLLPSLACLDTEALSTIGSTKIGTGKYICLLYTSPSPRDLYRSRMPSSA